MIFLCPQNELKISTPFPPVPPLNEIGISPHRILVKKPVSQSLSLFGYRTDEFNNLTGPKSFGSNRFSVFQLHERPPPWLRALSHDANFCHSLGQVEKWSLMSTPIIVLIEPSIIFPLIILTTWASTEGKFAAFFTLWLIKIIQEIYYPARLSPEVFRRMLLFRQPLLSLYTYNGN